VGINSSTCCDADRRTIGARAPIIPNDGLANCPSTILFQRHQYQRMQAGLRSRLTKERVDKLSSLGFVWNATSQCGQVLSLSRNKNCCKASTSTDEGLLTGTSCVLPDPSYENPDRSICESPTKLATHHGVVDACIHTAVIRENQSPQEFMAAVDGAFTTMNSADGSQTTTELSGSPDRTNESTEPPEQSPHRSGTGTGVECGSGASPTRRSHTSKPETITQCSRSDESTELCHQAKGAIVDSHENDSNSKESTGAVGQPQRSLRLFPSSFVPQVSHLLQAKIHHPSFCETPQVVQVVVPIACTLPLPYSATALSHPSGAEGTPNAVLQGSHRSWNAKSLPQSSAVPTLVYLPHGLPAETLLSIRHPGPEFGTPDLFGEAQAPDLGDRCAFDSTIAVQHSHHHRQPTVVSRFARSDSVICEVRNSVALPTLHPYHTLPQQTSVRRIH
jgi:hypothetical protein